MLRPQSLFCACLSLVNVGTIKLELLNPARLALQLSTIELLTKSFTSTFFASEIIHFYLMLISPSSGGDLCIQLDIYCKTINGAIELYVMFWSHTVGSATAWDIFPSGTHMQRLEEFEVLTPTMCVGDLLEILIDANLDTMTINMNNAMCGRFCFQVLNNFAKNGIIREDWMEDMYQWHEEICNAPGATYLQCQLAVNSSQFGQYDPSEGLVTRYKLLGASPHVE
ncbi:hypothetical protein ARMGADRAFT_1035696 [Armillaria gallica]|uniref:Uncharacterized protein n=1 Tax=Armillaria gallica TaxID=47427 RepID=A0A2H3D4B8_ARMGA|nr:hypothetical protein ARMGADRAFT_1035696 [Armillaria gallica]